MDIKSRRILASIPTNSIDEKAKLPKSMGSGCIIEYKGFNLFLTVYHTVEDYSLNTGIVADFDEHQGVKLIPLGIRPPIVKGNLKTHKIDNLDFSYAKCKNIPECYFFIVEKTGKITTKKRRIALTTDLQCTPTATEEYGFAGFIRGCLECNPNTNSKFQTTIHQELAYYDNLKYKESDDDYYIFSLPNNSYSHSNFQGTSGAPILDSKGNLVSLVACGRPSIDGKEWIIYGFNLTKYKVMIDIECGIL